MLPFVMWLRTRIWSWLGFSFFMNFIILEFWYFLYAFYTFSCIALINNNTIQFLKICSPKSAISKANCVSDLTLTRLRTMTLRLFMTSFPPVLMMTSDLLCLSSAGLIQSERKLLWSSEVTERNRKIVFAEIGRNKFSQWDVEFGRPLNTKHPREIWHMMALHMVMKRFSMVWLLLTPRPGFCNLES